MNEIRKKINEILNKHSDRLITEESELKGISFTARFAETCYANVLILEEIGGDRLAIIESEYSIDEDIPEIGLKIDLGCFRSQWSNLNYLEQASILPPADWAEYERLSKQLKAAEFEARDDEAKAARRKLYEELRAEFE